MLASIRILLLILAVYVAAVIQTALCDVMRIGQLEPDLLLLVAITWLLTINGRWAFLVAGAVVLFGDLIAPGRVGVGAAWMLLSGYALVCLHNRLRLDYLACQLAAVWVAATAWTTAVALTGRLLGDVALPWPTLLGRAVGVGAYTAGVGVPMLMVLNWIREPFAARRRKLAGL